MQMTVADAIHLNRLHNILNSGVILEAAKDWLKGEIANLEKAFGLGEKPPLYNLSVQILETLPNKMFADEVVFVCIGTDRCTGDSLGPMVGTELLSLGYNVIGTIEEPAHGMNLQERVKEVPPNKMVIAIDACLGQVSSVGNTKFLKGSVKPGAGVNRYDLPRVGDYHVQGIVNVGGFMDHLVLQNTRLSLIKSMANEILGSIQQAIPKRELNFWERRQ